VTPCKILVVLGLALAGPFSIAQEIVTQGNNEMPYQPPSWFSRMAQPEVVYSREVDFYVGVQQVSSSYGRATAGSGIKYFCGLEKNEKGEINWRFCDM